MTLNDELEKTKNKQTAVISNHDKPWKTDNIEKKSFQSLLRGRRGYEQDPDEGHGERSAQPGTPTCERTCTELEVN